MIKKEQCILSWLCWCLYRQQVLCQKASNTPFPSSFLPLPFFCVFPSPFGLHSSYFPSALIFPLTSAPIPLSLLRTWVMRASLTEVQLFFGNQSSSHTLPQSYGNAANASSNASTELDPLSSLPFEEILCWGLLIKHCLETECILTHLFCFSFSFLTKGMESWTLWENSCWAERASHQTPPPTWVTNEVIQETSSAQLFLKPYRLLMESPKRLWTCL